jgi:group I intron endonuclease
VFGPLDPSLKGKCCIYVIWGINPETGEVKQYNGRAVNAYVRRGEHRKELAHKCDETCTTRRPDGRCRKSHTNVHMQNFANKYGLTQLVFRPFSGSSPATAKADETRVREFFQQDGQHVAFNMRDSSCGFDSESARQHFGKPIPEAQKAKHSAAMRGKNNPNFGKPSPLRGKKHSAEQNAKLSVAMTGENHPMFGKTHSPETRAKMSASRTGKHPSDEQKAKMSARPMCEVCHYAMSLDLSKPCRRCERRA